MPSGDDHRSSPARAFENVRPRGDVLREVARRGVAGKIRVEIVCSTFPRAPHPSQSFDLRIFYLAANIPRRLLELWGWVWRLCQGMVRTKVLR